VEDVGLATVTESLNDSQNIALTTEDGGKIDEVITETYLCYLRFAVYIYI